MAVVRAATAYRRQMHLQGQYGPGERLPAERELCEQFAVSRITIRRASLILAEEMLIQRRQGDGTFVSPTPSRRIPLLSTDFSESLAAHAPDIDRELESYEWQKATALSNIYDLLMNAGLCCHNSLWKNPNYSTTPKATVNVAASLQTHQGARVLFARRLDLLRDTPVAFDEIYLAEQVADRLSADDLGQLRFLERWQKVQHSQLGHLSQIIEAVAAAREQVQYLGGKVGDPMLKEVGVILLFRDKPRGLCVSHYRRELFRLTSTVRLSFVHHEHENN